MIGDSSATRADSASGARVPVLQRQLRDFGALAVLAIIIATVAFVVVRNTQLAASQQDLARRAAIALAEGRTALPTVHGVFVSAATPSKKHPYLRHRQIREPDAQWRHLGGSQPTAADDKLFYDAATRFEQAKTTELVEMMNDASGRAIAVRPACTGATKSSCSLAIALTSPAAPAPYPFLVMIGVLGLALAIAAAGALISQRAARVATFAGAVTLAVPTILWHAWIATTAILLIGAGLALAQRVQLTDRIAAGLTKNRAALSFLAPAAAAMFVLVATPFIIGILIGFYDHHNGTWTFVDIRNFVSILSAAVKPSMIR